MVKTRKCEGDPGGIDHDRQRLWVVSRLFEIGRFEEFQILRLVNTVYDTKWTVKDLRDARSKCAELEFDVQHPRMCHCGCAGSKVRNRDLLYLAMQSTYRCTIGFLSMFELECFRDLIDDAGDSDDFAKVLMKLRSRLERLRKRLGLPKIESWKFAQENGIEPKTQKMYNSIR